MSTPRTETPVPAAVQASGASRLTGLGHQLWLVVTHIPLTLGTVAVLWIVGAVTGSLVHGPSGELLDTVGTGVRVVGAGRWWTPLTAALWCPGLPTYLLTTLGLLMLGALAERRLGVRWTAALLVGTQLLGTLAALALAAIGAAVRAPGAGFLADQVSVLGPAIGAVGAGLAASNRLTALWRRRLRLLLVIGLGMLALFPGDLLDIALVCGGQIGLTAGRVMPGGVRHPLAPPSGPETRVLVAMVVAATALGPFLAALAKAPLGPLSVLQFVVLSPPPDVETVQRICASGEQVRECRVLERQLRLYGVGPALLSAIPVLLLLVLAEGLRRGRHAAWTVAVAVHLALGVLAALLAALVASGPTRQVMVLGRAPSARNVLLLALPPLYLLGMAALLILLRSRFTARAPVGSYRRLGFLALVVLLAVCVVNVLGSLAVRDQFDPPPDLGQLLADLPQRFLPPNYLAGIRPDFLPVGWLATVLFEWSGIVFWLVVIGALLLTFVRPRLVAGHDDADRARALLMEHGGENLSWLTTWRGNRYWFNSAGDAAIAYRVISSVALTTCDPIGRPSARLAAVPEFAEFCHDRGWTPCLYSVTEPIRAECAAMAWSSVQVAEETVLPLPKLAFTGKKWQDVRTALNKAGKAGITAQWHQFRHAPLTIVEQVRAISEEWVADKGLPEMGFTLGGLDELADDSVRCLIAVDADEIVHGITSWLPVYRDGQIVGWTLDFMRRRSAESGGFRGVMEFLIASAAMSCKEEGAEFISLSGAPLARLDRGTQPTGLQRLLDIAGRTLEPVYGFRSLLAFKAKFQPEYRPLAMAYPDPAALPSIGIAIGRAYLPDLSAAQMRRLLTRLRQSPPEGSR